jgi:hypothetical protein
MKQVAIALDGQFVRGDGSPKPAVPIVWSVAGSDSGAGAGLAADMRAIGMDRSGALAGGKAAAKGVRGRHLHPTQAKRMPWIAQGNDNLAYWCALLPIPVVAIAGMNVDCAAQAMACGAAGVAVISAITGAPSPETEIARLLQAVQAGRLLPRRASPDLPQTTLDRQY